MMLLLLLLRTVQMSPKPNTQPFCATLNMFPLHCHQLWWIMLPLVSAASLVQVAQHQAFGSEGSSLSSSAPSPQASPVDTVQADPSETLHGSMTKPINPSHYPKGVLNQVEHVIGGGIQSASDTLTGGANLFIHPIHSAFGAWHTITHGPEVAQAIKADVVHAFKEDPYRATGYALGTLGMAAYPWIMNARNPVGTGAKIARLAQEAGVEVANEAKLVDELATLARKVEQQEKLVQATQKESIHLAQEAQMAGKDIRELRKKLIDPIHRIMSKTIEREIVRKEIIVQQANEGIRALGRESDMLDVLNQQLALVKKEINHVQNEAKKLHVSQGEGAPIPPSDEQRQAAKSYYESRSTVAKAKAKFERDQSTKMGSVAKKTGAYLHDKMVRSADSITSLPVVDSMTQFVDARLNYPGIRRIRPWMRKRVARAWERHPKWTAAAVAPVDLALEENA